LADEHGTSLRAILILTSSDPSKFQVAPQKPERERERIKVKKYLGLPSTIASTDSDSY